MNSLAVELNEVIENSCPSFFGVLSGLGRRLFFPKGILTQTAEARERAHLYNATIGIARADGHAMNLESIMGYLPLLSPDQVLDYAPATGNRELRARWLSDMREKNPSLGEKPVSLPVVTSGITHGLTITAEMFVDPGDVLVLPDKFWGNYRMIYTTRHGAEIRSYPFFTREGGFNVDALARCLSGALEERGKAVAVLNFPNNPTGYSITRKEAGRLVEALLEVSGEGRDVVVVLDDAYFGLFYTDDALPESLFALLAGSGEHLFPVKLDGATKEEYAWGLRVGFITFSVMAGGREAEVYEALEKKVGGAIRGNISNCSQLGQSLLLAAMGDPEFSAQKRRRYETMKERALAVKKALRNPAYSEVWDAYPFNAGYFMCLRLKGIDAEDFRARLLKEYGVGVIAEGNEDIRVAFSCLETGQIQDLFNIMYRCASEMRGAG